MKTKTSTWYECSVSYDKITENGTEKRVIEKYVVEALSFAEAEHNITNELASYVNGELKVKGIVPAQYKEIFFSEVDSNSSWFKVKVKIVTLDEKLGREKNTAVVYLVQSSDISTAKTKIEKELDESMIDCNLSGINETKIIDVFIS